MSKFSPLCAYYPSAVVIVDDSQRFLTKLSLVLDTRIAYVLFSDPDQALKFIERNSVDSHVLKTLIENPNAETLGLKSSEHHAKIDLSNLYHKIYDANRFNETSVIVVDYSMPGMNGYEVCQNLADNPIKKIMLTGEANDSLAVQLFNQGILDRFILKSDSRFDTVINATILEFQKIYFSNKSKTLLDVLNAQSQYHLNDPSVIDVFDDLCQENDIAEYYMISPTGNYFLLGFDGTPYWFIIIDEAELLDYQEVARDQKSSASIIKLLKDGKKIPYFPGNNEFMNAQGNAWEAYMYPANKIIGNKTYYYSFIKDEDLFEIRRDKILSYQDYLENEWPPK